MNSTEKEEFKEAIAAAIRLEKDCFDFYQRMMQEIPEVFVQELFRDLSEDVENHLVLIEEIYQQVIGGIKLPDFKQLSDIHSFHSRTIQKYLDKLDEITASEVNGDGLEAIIVALREGEEAAAFYNDMKTRFKNPYLRILFHRLSYFNSENRAILESSFLFLVERNEMGKDFYWDDVILLTESATTTRIKGTIKKPKKKAVLKKKKPAPKVVKKKVKTKTRVKPKTKKVIKPKKSKSGKKKK